MGLSIVLDDIDWNEGSDNTAGTQQSIYFINKFDVQIFPALPKLETATSLEALATVAGNIVLKPGKKPSRIYSTLETSSITSESQGDIDAVSFKNALKFLHPGNKAKADGFTRFAKNGSWYILTAETDGAIRLIGHPGYPGKMISAPGTTGEKTADRKGRTFTFQSVWGGPAPIFTGKVMVAPADAEGEAVEFELDFLK